MVREGARSAPDMTYCVWNRTSHYHVPVALSLPLLGFHVHRALGLHTP